MQWKRGIYNHSKGLITPMRSSARICQLISMRLSWWIRARGISHQGVRHLLINLALCSNTPSTDVRASTMNARIFLCSCPRRLACYYSISAMRVTSLILHLAKSCKLNPALNGWGVSVAKGCWFTAADICIFKRYWMKKTYYKYKSEAKRS